MTDDLDELERKCAEWWPVWAAPIQKIEVLALIERVRRTQKDLSNARWQIYLSLSAVEWEEGDVAILDGDNVRALDAEARRDPAVSKKIEEDLEEAREEMEKDRRRGEN